MPRFKAEEPREFKLLPAGDYKFCVKACSTGLSIGKTTNGSWNCELELEMEGQGQTVTITLIDHEKTKWKLNNFLMSCGVMISDDEDWEFNKSRAEDDGIRWIDPIGLRGWCRVFVEDYTKDGKARQSNKIDIFYTNKEKLPALVTEEDQPFE